MKTEVIKVDDIKQMEGNDRLRAEMLLNIDKGKIKTHEVEL